MRLIHLTSSGGWGGREMYPATLASAQERRGYEVSLVAKKNTALARCLETSELDHDLLRPRAYIDPFAIWSLARILEKRRPDIIHVHFSRDLSLVCLACSIAHQRPAIILHKHIASAGNKRDPLHRYLYGRLDFVVAISAFVKRSLLASCPIDKQRIKVIYYGVDTDKFKSVKEKDPKKRVELRSELGAIGPEKILAGVVGRLESRKGQDVFLRSAALLANQVPEMRFAVVGPPMGSYDRELKELTASLGIEERVVFTGARKDVNNVMAAFDILAVPSLEEAFGLVAAEGMLTGLPVVAARAGALPEFIEDSKTGLLVKVSDPAELAEALLRLARDADMRESLGRRARHWAFENLSLERALCNMEDLYKECLSQK